MAESIELRGAFRPSRFGLGGGLSTFSVAWVVRALLIAYLGAVIALHVATIPTIFEMKQTACVAGECFWGQVNGETLGWLDARGISARTYAFVATGVPLLIPILGHLLAGVTIWQRPTNWLPIFFVMSIAICNIGASGAIGVVMMENPQWERTIMLMHVPTLIAMPLLTLVFPTGRVVPKVALLIFVFVVLDIIFFISPALRDRWPELLGSTADTWVVYGEFVAVPIILWRIHVTTDRLALRQTKIWFYGQLPWIAYLVVIVFLANEDVIFLEGGVWSIVAYLSWAITVLCVIVGFLMAIYLYNVYDLSIVIRRSIVYGALTLALAGLFLLIVAVISTVFRTDDSPIPAMFATLAVAITFAPLRNWMQRQVRRLLYGDEEDPYGVLSKFGQHLEETSAPDRLLRVVVDLAQDTLRVPGVALTVADAPALNVRTGTITPRPLETPVRYQGAVIGKLAVAQRGPDDAFSSADRRLIEEIARQTGIAVHSTLLSEDLRQSREQIVTAREEERRRIRNDLHDGLGPALAALSLQVEIARDLIASEPDRSEQLLENVLEQTRESILDIRRLVYDLRPSALDDLGLLGAIRTQASRWESPSVRISLNLPHSLPPISAAIEVALYRIAQEALANVARHSGATDARVRLEIIDQLIRLEVSDNGRGIVDQAVPGVGLRSMEERANELGGRCVISRAPEGGVMVTAEFALMSEREAHGE